ncbi:hypothetical protein EJB05_31525, partial [Eragrostis curvula]
MRFLSDGQQQQQPSLQAPLSLSLCRPDAGGVGMTLHQHHLGGSSRHQQQPAAWMQDYSAARGSCAAPGTGRFGSRCPFDLHRHLLFFYVYTIHSFIKAVIMTAKPFNGIDFLSWKEKVQDILKSLELDYVLHTVKPFPPTSGLKDYDEKMHEYHSKLEKWKKDNKFAK